MLRNYAVVDWFKIVFLKLDGDTELARAVDVLMVRAKRINILIINVNKLFSISSSRCFLKEIENKFSVFLSSYRNTREIFSTQKKDNKLFTARPNVVQ